MDVQIVELPARRVIGVPFSIRLDSVDWNAIWREGYDPHHAALSALAEDRGCYGVYYAGDAPGEVDFLAGMMAPADATPPEGCVARAVPGGAYALVRCTLGQLGPTWGAVYGRWLPAGPYAEDETRPALEYYPLTEISGPDTPVELYIALRRKS